MIVGLSGLSHVDKTEANEAIFMGNGTSEPQEMSVEHKYPAGPSCQYLRLTIEAVRNARERCVQLASVAVYERGIPVPIDNVTNPGGNNPDEERPDRLLTGSTHDKWLFWLVCPSVDSTFIVTPFAHHIFWRLSNQYGTYYFRVACDDVAPSFDALTCPELIVTCRLDFNMKRHNNSVLVFRMSRECQPTEFEVTIPTFLHSY